MRYIMVVYETPADVDRRDDPAGDPYIAAWRAYHKALVEADVYVGGAPLEQAATATTVRLREGRRLVQDGPTRHRHHRQQWPGGDGLTA